MEVENKLENKKGYVQGDRKRAETVTAVNKRLAE
jgi:hypothetical protein